MLFSLPRNTNSDRISFHKTKNAGKDCIDENKTYIKGNLPIDAVLVNDIVKFIQKS